jgi:hypothetical protein
MEKPEKKRDLPQTLDQSGASKCYYNQLAQEVCDRLIADCNDISTFDGLKSASDEISGRDN